jgi:hypothetical protein
MDPRGRLRSTRVGTQHLIDERDLEDLVSDDEVVPRRSGDETLTGEPVPNFVARSPGLALGADARHRLERAALRTRVAGVNRHRRISQ